MLVIEGSIVRWSIGTIVDPLLQGAKTDVPTAAVNWPIRHARANLHFPA